MGGVGDDAARISGCGGAGQWAGSVTMQPAYRAVEEPTAGSERLTTHADPTAHPRVTGGSRMQLPIGLTT
jgi:hypothetical protein